MHACACVSYTMHAMMVINGGFFYTCSAATQSSEASAEGNNIGNSEGGSPPHTQALLNKGLSQSAPDSNRGTYIALFEPYIYILNIGFSDPGAIPSFFIVPR